MYAIVLLKWQEDIFYNNKGNKMMILKQVNVPFLDSGEKQSLRLKADAKSFEGLFWEVECLLYSAYRLGYDKCALDKSNSSTTICSSKYHE